MDPQRLLDFIEQQADTRMTAREVFGSSLRDEIDATAGEIVEAVADMYADKTGERFSDGDIRAIPFSKEHQDADP